VQLRELDAAAVDTALRTMWRPAAARPRSAWATSRSSALSGSPRPRPGQPQRRRTVRHPARTARQAQQIPHPRPARRPAEGQRRYPDRPTSRCAWASGSAPRKSAPCTGTPSTSATSTPLPHPDLRSSPAPHSLPPANARTCRCGRRPGSGRRRHDHPCRTSAARDRCGALNEHPQTALKARHHPAGQGQACRTLRSIGLSQAKVP
jgi:hypothetical protein